MVHRRRNSSRPTFATESSLVEQGYQLVAGIDEVGRGALAGPVMAAAVILPGHIDPSWLSLVRDSKQLTPHRREALFSPIQEVAVAIGIGMVPAEEIDTHGILKATRLAMEQAASGLSCSPDFLLIDGIGLLDLSLPQRKVIGGDGLCLSIACASIIAKVTRDRLMVELDRAYPGYGLARHKGYGTKEHLARLGQFGPSPIHRRSFAPMREAGERRG